MIGTSKYGQHINIVPKVLVKTQTTRPFPPCPGRDNAVKISAAAQRFSVYPEERSAEAADWIQKRRELRENLDGLGDLDKWFYSKPTLTEIEFSVMERMEKSRKRFQVLHDEPMESRHREVVDFKRRTLCASQIAYTKRFVHTRDVQEGSGVKQFRTCTCSNTTAQEKHELHERALTSKQMLQTGIKTKYSGSFPSAVEGLTDHSDYSASCRIPVLSRTLAMAWVAHQPVHITESSTAPGGCV